MTYNQVIQLFRDTATEHKQIKSFATGEIWEVEGFIKPGIIYPMLFAVPTQTVYGENIVTRSFIILSFGQVKKDKSDEQEIQSDCELILFDFNKTLRNKSDDYELVGDPVMFPFKEDFGDWCAGWRMDIQITTNASNNYCDIPKT
jgi:hypothetical protein